MFILLKITNVIERCVIRIGQYASLLILPLILVTVFDVVSRKFPMMQALVADTALRNFFSPTKLQEMEWHFHAAVFLLAFGYAYLSNAHVRVDLVKEKLSQKRQAVLELFGLLFLALPYVGILCYFGWDFVHTSYVQNETSASMTGLSHRWMIKSVFLLGNALLVIACLSTAVKILLFVFGKDDVARAAQLSLNISDYASHESEVANEKAQHVLHDDDLIHQENPLTKGTQYK